MSVKSALVTAAVVVGGTAAISGAAIGGCLATPPASIAADCSADAGSQLSAQVNGLPPNSVVTLKAGGCYLINSVANITGRTGLTINGNGATLKRTTAGSTGQTLPLLNLISDTNLTISNLKIQGAYNRANGGGAYEGNYGIQFEADHGVQINDVALSDVQGDFLTLSPPNDAAIQSLSTGVSIVNSTFTNAGYHGLTVEAVNGLTVSNDTFTNMGVDAMDFEYDNYSTFFDANGNPIQAAQDNILITKTTWNDWQDDWFASLQGQMPGVQQDNVTLSGNTLNAGSPLVEVTGTNPYLTSSQYQNKNLVIMNNTGLQPAISTHGSGPPGTESTMDIQGVVGLTITGNTLALTTEDQPGPYLSVLQAFENQNMNISGNHFAGAYSILEPDSAANTGTPCNNTFGVNGSQTDGAC